MLDLVEVPHRLGKEPYVELAPLKVLAMEATPVKDLRPTKHTQQVEEQKDKAEKIDLTQSLAREPLVKNEEGKNQEEKDLPAVWQQDLINIKHKAAQKVHQHT